MENKKSEDCEYPVKYQPSTWTVELGILTPEEIVKWNYALPCDRLLH